VTRPVHRLPAEQENPARDQRIHHQRIAGPQHQQLTRPEDVATQTDPPFSGIDRPLFVLRRQLEPSAERERRIGIEHF
jgi:hypothetical protein